MLSGEAEVMIYHSDWQLGGEVLKLCFRICIFYVLEYGKAGNYVLVLVYCPPSLTYFFPHAIVQSID